MLIIGDISNKQRAQQVKGLSRNHRIEHLMLESSLQTRYE